MPESPCPHVSPAMIAAGFTTCAVCETTPKAPAGFGREDTSRQEAALAVAWNDLGQSLSDLAGQAAAAAKACARKRPNPDLDSVRAAIRSMDLAETAVDTAAYDLSTARGADG